MKKRNNPLLADPPREARAVSENRLGDAVTHEILRYFQLAGEHLTGPLDTENDLYRGVHVTPYPFVAMMYAISKAIVSENEYGIWAIEEDTYPVLIGFKEAGYKLVGDADVLTTAKDLLDFAKVYNENRDDYDEPEDFIEEFREEIAGSSAMRLDDWLNMSDVEPGVALNYGGQLGNMPQVEDLEIALDDLLSYMDREGLYWDDEDTFSKAAALALSIVPQKRILEDVLEKDVVCVCAVPPYADNVFAAQGPKRPVGWNLRPQSVIDFKELEHLADFGVYWEHPDFAYVNSIEELNERLLSYCPLLFGDKYRADFWHGTSLANLRRAFPSLYKKLALDKLPSIEPEEWDEEDEEE